jgi:uncharacterized membrane protein YccC
MKQRNRQIIGTAVLTLMFSFMVQSMLGKPDDPPIVILILTLMGWAATMLVLIIVDWMSKP